MSTSEARIRRFICFCHSFPHKISRSLGMAPAGNRPSRLKSRIASGSALRTACTEVSSPLAKLLVASCSSSSRPCAFSSVSGSLLRSSFNSAKVLVSNWDEARIIARGCPLNWATIRWIIYEIFGSLLISSFAPALFSSRSHPSRASNWRTR